MTANYWIEKLELQRHPEGGYFREVYRSEETITGSALGGRYSGDRSFSTSIYFLLESSDHSHFHRLRSDEIWHHYRGSAAILWLISPAGELQKLTVGDDYEVGENLQTLIPRDHWFATEVKDPDSYTLVGCTVAPGFDFSDFELADRTKLTRMFPQHSALIESFTPATEQGT